MQNIFIAHELQTTDEISSAIGDAEVIIVMIWLWSLDHLDG